MKKCKLNSDDFKKLFYDINYLGSGMLATV